MKWEYKILGITHNTVQDIEAELNIAGDAGWELVQMVIPELPMRAGSIGAWMKRPKQDREQQEERAPVAMRSYPKGSQGEAA